MTGHAVHHSNTAPTTRFTALMDRIPVWLLMSTALLAAALIVWLFLVMKGYDEELSKGTEQADIVSLELAFSAERANRIIQDWTHYLTTSRCGTPAQDDAGIQRTEPAIICARASIHTDWWFILSYTVFGFCLLTALVRVTGVPNNGLWIAMGLLPAAGGVLDAGENTALLEVIDAAGQAGSLWVATASVLASVKFLLLGLFFNVVLALLAFRLFARPWRDPDTQQTKIHLVGLDKVRDTEAAYLRSRRTKAGLDGGSEMPWIGLALSGGGIRSATVNLGVLQVLMRSKLFARIDYLSTVSGGGYIATALSSLLSFRKTTAYPGLADRQQYVFKDKDAPHFDPTDAQSLPFEAESTTPSAAHHRWLSGRMVLDHLRAFGEYLVRRRRLLSRDVLRAIGTVGSGIASTLTLFGLGVVLLASAVATLIEAAGGELPSPLYGRLGLYGYIAHLWGAVGGPGPLAASLTSGGLLSLAVMLAAGLVAHRVPVEWFRRDGDTPAEALQHRALWVVGGVVSMVGFVLLGPAAASQARLDNGLLLVPAFFLGGLLLSSLAYIALSISASQRPPLRSNAATRSYVTAVNGLFLYLLIVSVGTTLLPWVYSKLQYAGPTGVGKSGIGGVGALAAVISALLAWLRRHKGTPEAGLKRALAWLRGLSDLLQRWLLGVAVAVFLVVALLLALAALVSVFALAGVTNPTWQTYLIATGGISLVWLGLGYVVDFNKLSLHYFYRDRLTEAYMRTLGSVAGAATRHREVKRDHSEMRLSDLHGVTTEESKGETKPVFLQQQVQSNWGLRANLFKVAPVVETPFGGAATAAPYHLFSTCLNLTSDRDMRLRSRKSDIFIFSKLFCGSGVTGYVDTRAYRSGATKVSRAMTISGAAADSALGGQTFFAQSFASTLFNIRLGQWLENPRYRAGRHVYRRENLVFWPKYLLMEVFGMSDARRRLIHLSDGGHTGDNLGLVPLLQRRCGLILVVDAEYDPAYGFGSLINALRYAKVDMGITVHIDLSPIEPDDKGWTRKHFAAGHIDYPQTDTDPKAEGILLILKSSVTSADEEAIRKFRKTSPSFPQEPTVDQFFSEEQFEAYLAMGQAMAQRLLAQLPALGSPGLDLKKLAEQLEKTGYPRCTSG